MLFVRKLTLLIIITLIWGCNNQKSTLTDSVDSTVTIQKSPKRGLAYNLVAPADFEALKNGVSWWYNWYFKTDAPDDYFKTYQMEFIPMLWGGNKASDYVEVKNFRFFRQLNIKFAKKIGHD